MRTRVRLSSTDAEDKETIEMDFSCFIFVFYLIKILVGSCYLKVLISYL